MLVTEGRHTKQCDSSCCWSEENHYLMVIV